MKRWLAESLTVPNDPRVLAVLEWCAETRFGTFFEITNTVIGVAYISIPLVILAYLRRRPSVEHRWVFWCFIIFIAACGATHFAHVLIINNPALWMPVAMILHGFTAAISIVTAIALWPLLPRVVKIPTTREYEAVVTQLETQRTTLTADKTLLMRELNHRVRNTIAILIGNLRLQAKTVDNEGCREVLETAIGRLNAMARANDRIYVDDLSPTHVIAAEFVVKLCEDLEQQFHVPIHTDLDPSIMVSSDESMPLALIINDLITNAVKHGRPTYGAPAITVRLRRPPGNGDWELTVSDNGPGIGPEKVLKPSRRSLGMRLIKALAGQLGGELEVVSSAVGTTFRVKGRHFAPEAAAA